MNIIQLGIWQNNKNRNKYLVTGTRTNCTNAQDGETMVEYESNDGAKYTRELSEFIDKFKFITGLL